MIQFPDADFLQILAAKAERRLGKNDESLKRLNTDRIDLYQLHWPDISTPLEESMPDAGRLVFSDHESQLDFNTGKRNLREAYAKDFETRMERMKTASRQHAIPIIPVHTAGPVLDQVQKQLGSRGQ